MFVPHDHTYHTAAPVTIFAAYIIGTVYSAHRFGATTIFVMIKTRYKFDDTALPRYVCCTVKPGI